MTALRKSELSEAFRNEVARLKGAGFHLLPLGGGADGKAPLLSAWAGPRLGLAQILAPLHRTGSQVYGVRLDGLAVVDCDTDDGSLVAALEARFGPSPIHVRTPRGRHLYYRASHAVPNLRGEGLPVDIKTGGQSYVVGPLSLRPDGGFYAPVKGQLGVDGLPPLRAATRPQVGSAPIASGQRHVSLVREATRLVALMASPEDLAARLGAVRNDECADPATLPDSEIRGIARWAWECRLRGELHHGRDSTVPVHRLALDALRGLPGGSDATALYVTLADLHGHSPGKRFPLGFDAMRAAGLTELTTPRLRAARRVLEREGLLKLVSRHRAGIRPQLFVLQRLRPGLAEAGNVAVLPSGPSARGEGGEQRGEG